MAISSLGMWFGGNKVVCTTSTSSSAKVTGVIKDGERERERERVNTESERKEEEKRKRR